MTHINRLAMNYFAQPAEDPVPFPNGRNVGAELRSRYGVALELLCAANGTLDKLLEEINQGKENEAAGIPHQKLHFTPQEFRDEIVIHESRYITESAITLTQLDGFEAYMDQHAGLITPIQCEFITRHDRRVNSTMLGVSFVVDRLKREFEKCFNEPYLSLE